MSTQNTQPQRRLLRCAATRAKAGFTANSTLYGAMEHHGFPRPIKIGNRSVAWVEDEVDAWIERRKAERDAKVAS
jgi:prophage regulatory protein